jgi:hypothetical protein
LKKIRSVRRLSIKDPLLRVEGVRSGETKRPGKKSPAFEVLKDFC